MKGDQKMKKIKRLLGLVLCAALMLTAVTVIAHPEAEAATKQVKVVVTKTVKWSSGASVTIKNNTGNNMTVLVSGGYAAKDGKTITIKPGSSYKFSYGLFSCKGAMFTLYVNASSDKWTVSSSNCNYTRK